MQALPSYAADVIWSQNWRSDDQPVEPWFPHMHLLAQVTAVSRDVPPVWSIDQIKLNNKIRK